eukprot:TRINITY_DN4214_c0_g1_i1.p1 TRINITY_DN4214_c0_g1~~TRINITY_DN4214_c0_g1_i1.p1  ORF type:complete len:170 (+),score=41.76 TRINITY_DN4214_c0_g1_i1:64-573(+)
MSEDKRKAEETIEETPSKKECKTFVGKCLCGKVEFTVSGQPKFAATCHCSICRRYSGADYLPWVGFDLSSFEQTKGKDDVFGYKTSEMLERTRCKDCGCFVFALMPAYETALFSSAIFATKNEGLDPILMPTMHSYYDSRVVDIKDDLPKWKTTSSGEQWKEGDKPVHE